MQTPEKRIQGEVINFLNILGVFCFTVNNGGTWDPYKKTYRKRNSAGRINGISDILGIISNRFLAIEVKSEKGRLSPDQRVFLARVNDSGGIGFVARSIQDVARELTKHFPENIGLKKMATGEMSYPINIRIDQ